MRTQNSIRKKGNDKERFIKKKNHGQIAEKRDFPQPKGTGGDGPTGSGQSVRARKVWGGGTFFAEPEKGHRAS